MSTEVDYGPLQGLIGTWTGDKGMDVSPEPDGKEESPYYETIIFEAAGDVTNAESQILAIVRYHQVVTRKRDDVIFHDQVGYWTWDPREDTVMQSITIPRAVALLAGGKSGGVDGGPVTLEVAAQDGSKDWGIAQSPFMRDNARTTAFKHKITIDGDKMVYSETTTLDIYGKAFEHTDDNTLARQ
ncbi:hypothetical protein DRQ53_01780 [bacterium]|nr:MAG: hypothetical protein DRQ53_01780 [bacterium]